MPGLALTLQQAQRFWALDRQTCEAALRGLVQADFLVMTRAGTFVRAAPQIQRPMRQAVPGAEPSLIGSDQFTVERRWRLKNQQHYRAPALVKAAFG